jgi:hypothetical protein
MSELKNCPFCGSENITYIKPDWEEWDGYHCRGCGATAADKDNWNTRVMQWASVAERIPEDEKDHHVKSNIDDLFVCKFVDGKWRIWDDGIGCYRNFLDEVTHWLDDHTFDKDVK